MSDVLRIKDLKTGKWIEIPALKTPTDQHFDPESENAQSGQAVAEAVEPKLSKEVVDTLPEFSVAKENVIYAVKNADNTYTEYLFIAEHKEVLGIFENVGTGLLIFQPDNQQFPLTMEKCTSNYAPTSSGIYYQYAFTSKIDSAMVAFNSPLSSLYDAVTQYQESTEVFYDFYFMSRNAYPTIIQYSITPHWEVIGGDLSNYATKAYVDNLVGDINTVLASIVDVQEE